MDFKLEVPTALEYFASLVQSDAHFPLLEAATSVAQDRYPELDIQQVLDEVDLWSSRLKKTLACRCWCFAQTAFAQQILF